MSTHRGQSGSRQSVVPGSQVQLPPEHVPRPQPWLQPPQWAALDSVSTQAPPQATSPVGHSQMPATQVPPVGQEAQPGPHVAASVCASMQFPKQRVCPAAHFFSSAGQPKRTAEASIAVNESARAEFMARA